MLPVTADFLDNDIVGDGSTGIDGVRSILDGGALIDLARYAF
ncbi:hypothetical protein [Streptomyces sp. NPDC047042]